MIDDVGENAKNTMNTRSPNNQELTVVKETSLPTPEFPGFKNKSRQLVSDHQGDGKIQQTPRKNDGGHQ